MVMRRIPHPSSHGEQDSNDEWAVQRRATTRDGDDTRNSLPALFHLISRTIPADMVTTPPTTQRAGQDAIWEG